MADGPANTVAEVVEDVPDGGGAALWRRLRWHRPALWSLGLLAAVSVVCAAAPLIAPYEFDAIDLSKIRQAPSAGRV